MSGIWHLGFTSSQLFLWVDCSPAGNQKKVRMSVGREKDGCEREGREVREYNGIEQRTKQGRRGKKEGQRV